MSGLLANLPVLPVLLPFLAAVICLFFQGNLRAQRTIAGIASAGGFALALYLLLFVRANGVQATRMGDWPLAYGIVFAADLMGAMMLFFCSITQLAVWWFISAGVLSFKQEEFYVHPLFLMLCTGVNWAFMTGDLFNLFVSFEIILLSSYVLMAHGNGTWQIRETLKYVALNIVASTLFLAGVGFAYGAFGSLNMAELALRIEMSEGRSEALILGTILLAVFGMKAALFPVFFWLPDSYPKAPAGVLAYFSGVLTKVGVYALYRVFTTVFRDAQAWIEWFQPLILILAATTMLIGVLSALGQMTMRRILSFHIISQIGYMVFGLGVFTTLGIAAGLFFVLHQVIVKASLFLVADAVKAHEGTEELEKISGMATVYPALGLLFLIAAASLAGLPPTSGFFGKFGLVAAGFDQGLYLVAAISLVTSIFTLSSMLKIGRYSFWGEVKQHEPQKLNRGVIVATGVLVMGSVGMALFSGFFMEVSLEAAAQALDRREYIEAVLGEAGVALLRAQEDMP